MLSAYRTTSGAHGVPDEEIDSLDGDIAVAVVEALVRGTCGIAGWQPTGEREIRILDAGIDRVQIAF
jgi:hypothetical protein